MMSDECEVMNAEFTVMPGSEGIHPASGLTISHDCR